MKIQKTGMFCLNSTITRKTKSADEKVIGLTIVKEDPGEAAIVMRVDNFALSDDQTVQIKAIHERAVAELETVLGW